MSGFIRSSFWVYGVIYSLAFMPDTTVCQENNFLNALNTVALNAVTKADFSILEFKKSAQGQPVQIKGFNLSEQTSNRLKEDLKKLGLDSQIAVHKNPAVGALDEPLGTFLSQENRLRTLLQSFEKISVGQLKVFSKHLELTGTIENASDKDVIESLLKNALPETYPVQLILSVQTPVLSPYPFTVLKSKDNRIHVSGAAPSAGTQNRFLQIAYKLYGGKSYVSDNLKVASGMPDELWPAFIQQALPLLSMMSDGSMTVTGKEMELKGTSDNPVKVLNRITLLQSLYPDYKVVFRPETQQITAKPYRIHIQKSPTNILQIQGVLPDATTHRELEKLINQVLPASKVIEQITYADGVPDANWLKVLNQGLKAVLPLRSGSVHLEDRTVTISAGARTKIGRDKAVTALTETAFPAYQQTLHLVDYASLLSTEKQARIPQTPLVPQTSRQQDCMKSVQNALDTVPFEWVAVEQTFRHKNQPTFWAIGDALTNCKGVRVVLQMDAPRTYKSYYRRMIFDGLAKTGVDMSHLLIFSGLGSSPNISIRTF